MAKRRQKRWIRDWQMNAIYQNIQALTTNNPKIIYFTSPTSSKKQALVGMTLAKTLAKNKAKVLYYNVYAKTSFVDRYLPKSSNVMSEKSHQIHRTLHRGVDRLQIKTSAHGLHSFESLVKEWKEFYAYIFIDAYGPFQNEWAQTMLEQSDEVILYAKHMKTRKRKLSEAKQHIERRNKKILGVIYEQ